MSEQRTFFDAELSADLEEKRKLARRDDPVTSHLAAAHVVETGSAEVDRLRAAQLVSEYPGLTARELEDVGGWEVHRRLREAQRAGLIAEGEKRACSVTGMTAMTWVPAR